jgi:hypothetical protein
MPDWIARSGRISTFHAGITGLFFGSVLASLQ